MIVKNNTFNNFKPYQDYKTKKENSKRSILPIIGAATGTIIAYGASKKALNINAANKNQSGFKDAAHMISMALGANIGGVIAGSLGADKNKVAKKIHEAGFQMMNMSIPMLMVTSTLEICKKVKPLNNKPAKIIGSISAMVTGAVSATKITNAIKKDSEPKRKYTPKDTLANFDDIVATVEIGFKDVAKKIPVGKILPFIYTYNGARSGWKE